MKNPFIENTLSSKIFDLIYSSNKPVTIGDIGMKYRGQDRTIMEICQRDYWLYHSDYVFETSDGKKDNILSEEEIKKAKESGKKVQNKKPTFTKKTKLWKKQGSEIDREKYRLQVENTNHWYISGGNYA